MKHLLAVMVLASLGLASMTACSGPVELPSLPGSEDVPEPRLEALSAEVQEELRQKRERVLALLESDVEPETLAAAFGELGRSYQAHELHDAALACYDVARRLAPDEFDWHYYPAFIHLFHGANEEAVSLFEGAVKLDPGYLPARIHLAETILARGDSAAARAELEEVLRRDGSNARAHFDLGRLAAGDGDHAAAAEHFEAALGLEPQASAVRYPLAIAYQRLGEEDRAAAVLEQAGRNQVSLPDPRRGALGAETTDSRADLARGSRALVDDRPDEAVVWFRRAVDKDPSSPAARLVLGSALARTGDRGAALEQLLEAVRLAPDDASAHQQLASLMARGETPEAALEHFDRALEIDPENIAVHLELAQLLEDLGRYDAALGRYRQALRLDAQNEAALVGSALCLVRLGQKERAAAEMKRLVGQAPGSLALRVNLGTVLLELGEVEEGVEQLRVAVGMEGDAGVRSLAYSNLGLAYARRGERRLAIDHHRAAVELDPTLLSSRVWLADLLRDQGEWREAAHHYGVARRLSPNLVEVWVQEARALASTGDQASARRALEEGLTSVGPDAALAHELARLLATSSDPALRDGRRAVELAVGAFRAAQRTDYAATVAMAFAEAGRFEEALDWQTRVLEEARRRGDRAEIERLGAALGSYRRGEPPHRWSPYPVP